LVILQTLTLAYHHKQCMSKRICDSAMASIWNLPLSALNLHPFFKKGSFHDNSNIPVAKKKFFPNFFLLLVILVIRVTFAKRKILPCWGINPRNFPFLIFYALFCDLFIVGENGAIEVVGNLAPTVFRPLATEELHFKNYQL
jgi:hypothetical protein